MTSDAGADRAGNPFAAIGVVLAAVVLLGQLVLSGLAVLLPVALQRSGAPIAQIGVVFAALGAVTLVLHLVTALLGVLGLALRRSRRALAGAVTGIGAAGAVATLGSLLIPPIVSAAL